MRVLSDGKLLVATHNDGKLAEFAALLAPLGIEAVSAKALGLGEPVETGTTFLENARIKAHAAAKGSGMPALSDDSGLEVDALGGAPGVYTADWAETRAGRDFRMAMERVHSELVQSQVPEPWTGRFCCTLVLAWPDGEDAVFAGTAEGRLVWPTRGAEGHGFDPMFQPDAHDLTFAEMSSDAKNAISHRADAFRKLVAALAQ